MDVQKLWQLCLSLPFGKRVFACLLGWKIPYTGSIRPLVEEFGQGTVSVRLRDRRRVRNHLDSVHAVALMNVSELSTGLAVISRLPKDARMILVGFEIEYLKKARGTLTARAICPEIPDNSERNLSVDASVFNTSGEEVCKATARWRIGPNRRG